MTRWTSSIALALATTVATAVLVPAAMAGDAPRTIRLNHGAPAEHAYGLGVNRFAEIVGNRSGGALSVKHFANGALGAEVPSISSAQGGVLEIALTTTSAAVGTLKEFGVFDLPYLINDEREADALLDGPIGKEILDKLPEKGLVGLCYWESGFRNTTNSRRPIAKLDDIAGLKIRTIQNPVFVDTLNALGANAVPMPFTELYTALESKAVDGMENPYSIVLSTKMFEVQKYVSATKHAFTPVVMLVSKKFWDTLRPGEQKIMQDACMEARLYQRQVVREQNAGALAELRAKGMIYSEIPEPELARMRARVKPVIEKYTQTIGEPFVKRTFAELDRLRQKK